jgi:HEAT repeat protein
MEHAVVFAKNFARLVWLVRHEPESESLQKTALREVVAAVAEAPVVLSVQHMRLTADETQLPQEWLGVHELSFRMLAHGGTRISIPQRTSAMELLSLARILAADTDGGGSAAALSRRLESAHVKSVRVSAIPKTTGENIAYRPADPDSPGPPDDERVEPEVLVTRPMRGLLEDVRRARSLPQAEDSLQQVVLAARAAFRRDEPDTLADAAHALLTLQKFSGNVDQRPLYARTVTRLLTPPVLKAIVQLVPLHPERYNLYLDLLESAGEAGAEAVVAQMGGAASIAIRRVYYDILGALDQAVPVLIRMLDDARWYVVRNAVDLLGTLEATAAEPYLKEMLTHDDDRVRRAAAMALARLGTPGAQRDLYYAMSSDDSPLRHMATTALITGEGDRSVNTMIEALRGDADLEVQKSIIMALGRVATPPAVAALVRAAHDERGFLKRKRVLDVRIAAVQALGDAGTAEAMSALRDLARDPQKQVRGAAMWVIQSRGALKTR